MEWNERLRFHLKTSHTFPSLCSWCASCGHRKKSVSETEISDFWMNQEMESERADSWNGNNCSAGIFNRKCKMHEVVKCKQMRPFGLSLLLCLCTVFRPVLCRSVCIAIARCHLAATITACQCYLKTWWCYTKQATRVHRGRARERQRTRAYNNNSNISLCRQSTIRTFVILHRNIFQLPDALSV